MKPEVFLDTAYAIALVAPNDRHHAVAVSIAGQLKRDKVRFITSQAIALEIGDALARLQYRPSAVKLLRSLVTDPLVEIVAITSQLYSRAFQLYAERPDKEWGMTDCLSFIIMQDRGIIEALTTDEHFQQAGFRAILREMTSST